MQVLQKIQIENNSELGAVVSSRVIAQELEKRHAHVIRDLERILTDPNVGSLIIPSNYKDNKGETRKEYLLTKDGFTLYMFNIQGHNDFKMAYINKFNEMERQIAQPVASYMIKDPVKRAELWIEEQKEKQHLLEQNTVQQKQIEEYKPKALFADAVNSSNSSILVGELAKLISQNGVKIGQNRLFEWLRNNGYLIKRGENYNLPTQRSCDLGIMDIKKRTQNNPDGSIRVTRTTKITGKGQQYFINKFLANEL
ncbi:phage antirepressor KilAC domain-containing protein [Staphylococcus haemolyticus]|uniref:phage antirepressor KilAC domain-containing protein n=1 Tax=Staphylococcus haemolyticus TaxID=1283 RepID=UPI001F0A3418|nr:phage regulatory protein/antirepressor Ant [Staphylococcus haemolyticus]MCH4365403.1 phage regulatory protein/antirepressor Ant [Staphylococcus haemolyticus]MCH4367714.1 phage regulatory protein/antirepressor Ant [Staphylococcus haemolyticus]